MVKEQLLVDALKQLGDATSFHKAVRAVSTPRVHHRTTLEAGTLLARVWFDEVRPALERVAFQPDTVAKLSTSFESVLRMCNGRPTKTVLLPVLGTIIATLKDVIHQIEIGTFSNNAGGLSIAPYIEGLSTDEGEYLDEAQRCLSANALRGCIVLGWCATIARIHAKIADLGFENFNKATHDMKAKTVGRFKPFNKTFDVDSLSELQRIFDTDLLWVLEFLTLIDGNQHQRLRHCFEFRNNSAHPGLAPITGENLYSFFSDITQIVLKNPKFVLTPKPA